MDFLSYKQLLRYRSVWLGVAMIWIMLFHLPFSLPSQPLSTLQSIGYGGVDLCLFASGIGCYFSLTADSDPGHFLKKRVSKLLPTYLIFILLWLLYRVLDGLEVNFQMALGNILAIQSFTTHSNDFNWYISAILLFYLLAPYLKLFIDRTNSYIKYWFVLFLIALSIPFWFANTLIITATRLPIFYIGMLFADKCQDGVSLSAKGLLYYIGAFAIGTAGLFLSFRYVAGLLWPMGLFWYPFILMTPAICIILSYVMHYVDKVNAGKHLTKILTLIGEYSFELYLLHIPLIEVIEKFITHFQLQKFQILIWMTGIPILALGCYILRRITNFCKSFIR